MVAHTSWWPWPTMALASHPKICLISLTGSTEAQLAGRAARQALVWVSQSVKRSWIFTVGASRLRVKKGRALHSPSGCRWHQELATEVKNPGLWPGFFRQLKVARKKPNGSTAPAGACHSQTPSLRQFRQGRKLPHSIPTASCGPNKLGPIAGYRQHSGFFHVNKRNRQCSNQRG